MTSGTEKRIRTRIVTFRLSPEEHAALDDAADRAGLSASSYARKVILGTPGPRQVRRPPVERKELARLLGEIGKIGSNLNQLARAANTGVVVYDNEIDAALKDLAEVRTVILKVLGRAA